VQDLLEEGDRWSAAKKKSNEAARIEIRANQNNALSWKDRDVSLHFLSPPYFAHAIFLARLGASNTYGFPYIQYSVCPK
jgi:predicted RNA-binding protein